MPLLNHQRSIVVIYTHTIKKPSALKKMRPLLRRAVKVCRLERVVPPLCGNKNVITALRRAKKVCRLESWECVPPLPPDGKGDSLFGIGTAHFKLIRIVSQYHRSPNFFNFKININMATAKNLLY